MPYVVLSNVLSASLKARDFELPRFENENDASIWQPLAPHVGVRPTSSLGVEFRRKTLFFERITMNKELRADTHYGKESPPRELEEASTSQILEMSIEELAQVGGGIGQMGHCP